MPRPSPRSSRPFINRCSWTGRFRRRLSSPTTSPARQSSLGVTSGWIASSPRHPTHPVGRWTWAPASIQPSRPPLPGRATMPTWRNTWSRPCGSARGLCPSRWRSAWAIRGSAMPGAAMSSSTAWSSVTTRAARPGPERRSPATRPTPCSLPPTVLPSGVRTS